MPKRTCFVLMPISDQASYDPGHFNRVYEYLIKPACEAEDLETVRADEVRSTNHIVVDIIQRILQSDMVVCDLSSRNPNVLYELGFRQAFDLPVVLLKDQATDRIFDIQGLRTLEYDQSLRVDAINKDRENLRRALKATSEQGGHEVNSLIRLLSVQKAVVTKGTKVSEETSLVLNAIKELASRVSSLEGVRQPTELSRFGSPTVVLTPRTKTYTLPNGERAEVGATIYAGKDRTEIGSLEYIDASGVVVKGGSGNLLVVPPDSEDISTLSTVPF
jgi:hypothetical protein